MDTLAWIVLGFLVVSVGVAALARSTTARWEREARTRSVRRPDTDAPATPRHRMAVRLGRALGTAAATARPVAGPVRGVVATTGRRLAAFRQRVGGAAVVLASPRRPASRRRRRSAAAGSGAERTAVVPRRTRQLTAWVVHRPARSRARRPSDEVPDGEGAGRGADR